jgi:hypothetical protein
MLEMDWLEPDEEDEEVRPRAVWRICMLSAGGAVDGPAENQVVGRGSALVRGILNPLAVPSCAEDLAG